MVFIKMVLLSIGEFCIMANNGDMYVGASLTTI